MRHYEVRAEPVALSPDILARSDFALIITDHGDVEWEMVVEHSPLVVGTSNAARRVHSGKAKVVKV